VTLTGSLVRLYPYDRGAFPREVLYAMWRAVEDDHASRYLFYGQVCQDEHHRGDLQEFVTYFTDPKRLLYIAQSLRTDELAGMVWFDDIQPGYRAAANVYFRRRSWGPAALEGSRLAIGAAFDALKLEHVWAYTPWDHAVRHAKRAGMMPVALLPGFVRIDGQPRDIHVLRLKREDF
jgi:hypothetical protein